MSWEEARFAPPSPYTYVCYILRDKGPTRADFQYDTPIKRGFRPDDEGTDGTGHPHGLCSPDRAGGSGGPPRPLPTAPSPPGGSGGGGGVSAPCAGFTPLVTTVLTPQSSESSNNKSKKAMWNQVGLVTPLNMRANQFRASKTRTPLGNGTAQSLVHLEINIFAIR